MVPEVGDDADGAYSDDGGWNSDEDLRDIVARANTSGFGLSNAPDFAGRLNPKHNPDTETIKSRFTEYSMSSSILPRSEGMAWAPSRARLLSHPCQALSMLLIT